MRKILTVTIVLTMFLTMSVLAFFGERHSGNGSTRETAAQAAEARAKRAAERKGTCYTDAKLEECKQEKDGSWTCYATSANHKGSCP